jgi:hypothetical protein
MNPVALRLGRVIAFVVLLQLGGAHWLVLQSIAWSGMLLRQAREARLIEAMQKTFDGAHPCQLCKGVSHGQQKEKKSRVPFELGKVPLLFEPADRFVFSHPLGETETQLQARFIVRAEPPLIPPPRVALS